jgi:alpha-D-ribose 1-methylphosphonate 5-triphosphate synthase subunit PhnG
MSVLARSSAAELEAALAPFQPLPDAQWLRQPETGLVMVRARMGGAGAQFNFGEAPVTRCAMRLPSGAIGMAWVLGRDTRHAEYAARIDAMLQEPSAHQALREQVITPIARRQHEARELASRKAAATTVSFYTLARGEDQP